MYVLSDDRLGVEDYARFFRSQAEAQRLQQDHIVGAIVNERSRGHWVAFVGKGKTLYYLDSLSPKEEPLPYTQEQFVDYIQRDDIACFPVVLNVSPA